MKHIRKETELRARTTLLRPCEPWRLAPGCPRSAQGDRRNSCERLVSPIDKS